MKKELLAKLLATENITVVQKNLETASFDVKNRVLTMPIWDDEMMTEDTEDHLTGHEVGHALYTPADEWLAMAEASSPNLRTFVNVVEDARIERMIQARYPGLRRSFIRSYNNMLDKGFFGKSKDAVNSYKLIDRLNVHFKCGTAAAIEFTKDEMPWVNEIDSAETFSEVVDIANRLYELAKEELEKEKEAEEEALEKFSGENINPSAMNFGDEEFEDYNDGEETDSMEDESSAPSDGDEDSDSMGRDEEEEEELDEDGWTIAGPPEEPSSKTDEILNDSIKSEYSSTTDRLDVVGNVVLNMDYPTDNIISPKEILGNYVSELYNPLKNVGSKVFKTFQTNNRSVINYMVKEFEMKKRAAEYSRTTLAKTGVIDPVKMNNYRYSDDIFRKMEVVPEGKNHGLLMYLDWSGSMSQDLLATVEQLMNLVMFCKQVQIPFRVFAFSDAYRKYASTNVEKNGFLSIENDCYLLELFNNKMSHKDFNSMCTALMRTASWFMYRYNNKAYENKYFNDIHSVVGERIYARWEIPTPMQLGGTPLQSTIVGAVPIYHKFKNDNRLDIVNTIFLTDGDSQLMAFTTQENDFTDFSNGSNRKRISVINPITRKSMRLPQTNNYRETTDFLLRLYREFTNSDVIGFRILPYNKRQFRSELYNYLDFLKVEEFFNLMKKDKFITIPNSGYSEFFGIAGGKNLETANTTMKVSDDAKKGAITSAFKKANGNRKTTRVMLNKFIDIVA